MPSPGWNKNNKEQENITHHVRTRCNSIFAVTEASTRVQNRWHTLQCAIQVHWQRKLRKMVRCWFTYPKHRLNFRLFSRRFRVYLLHRSKLSTRIVQNFMVRKSLAKRCVANRNWIIATHLYSEGRSQHSIVG